MSASHLLGLQVRANGPSYVVKVLDFLMNGKLVNLLCKNVSDLVNKVFELRNHNMYNYIVKFYFDNDQKYLKLTCSLILKEWK